MDSLLALTLLGLVLYLIVTFFRKRYSYFEELGIPYVPPWPLFGNNASFVLRRKHITQTVTDLYRYNPDAKYIGVFDFVRPVIMIRDPELIKSITIKNFDNFVDHYEFVDPNVDPLMAGNLFALHGDKWKEGRNILSPAFTSSKMKAMFELMVHCGEKMIDHLSDLSKSNSANEIDVKDLFCRYSNDVIASCAFGIEINSLKDRNNDFFKLGRSATNFEGLLSVKFFLARAFPGLMRMFKFRLIPAYVADFFQNVVKTTVDERDAKGIRRPDMIQLMMDARGKTKEFKLDIAEMTSQAFIFFFGGFDTTSTQMCAIAHELILNPDVQQRLQQEIDDVLVETNGKPTYEAINSMSYLDAIYHESMRCHPQANVLDRTCTRAFELPPALPGCKPITLPTGINLWIPTAAIHRDTEFHEEPDKFNPDRFFNKKVTINQVENLGFGIGPRACIGNRFAILETKILFFHLLSKFTLKRTTKTAKNFDYSTKSISIVPKGGYWFKVEPRNK